LLQLPSASSESCVEILFYSRRMNDLVCRRPSFICSSYLLQLTGSVGVAVTVPAPAAAAVETKANKLHATDWHADQK